MKINKINRVMISALLAGLIILTIFTSRVDANDNKKEDVRAVWISTIYNLDYPSSKSNPEAQKSEFLEILDSLEEVGINKVIVQVRPKADALYNSEINPWSEVLTGVQGKNPGYDPLEFMIEETHKRNMTLHAWLNPYRVTTSGVDVKALNEEHLARKNPNLLLEYNNALIYNPELPEVKKHIINTVDEIIKNYDVDGIHFDDYFYPSNYPLPKGESRDGITCNKRRAHVDEMIKSVHNTINTYDKSIKFGVSPMGIWKNSKTDMTGSKTNGREAYYAVYSDTRKWIENDWIDYIVPQIYWETGHRLADYETLVKWWDKEVEDSNVELYIGQGIYKSEVASEIYKQLKINEKYKNIKGSYYFSLRDILNNRENVQTQLKNYYDVDKEQKGLLEKSVDNPHSIFELDYSDNNIEVGNSSILSR